MARRSLGGREFQNWGAKVENLRPPCFFRLNGQGNSRFILEERSSRVGTYRCILVAIKPGPWSERALKIIQPSLKRLRWVTGSQCRLLSSGLT